jgi:hypothetical protein
MSLTKSPHYFVQYYYITQILYILLLYHLFSNLHACQCCRLCVVYSTVEVANSLQRSITLEYSVHMISLGLCYHIVVSKDLQSMQIPMTKSETMRIVMLMLYRKLLSTLHHMMVVCVVESKTVVHTASHDVGVWCGMKNYCAHCIT